MVCTVLPAQYISTCVPLLGYVKCMRNHGPGQRDPNDMASEMASPHPNSSTDLCKLRGMENKEE